MMRAVALAAIIGALVAGAAAYRASPPGWPDTIAPLLAGRQEALREPQHELERQEALREQQEELKRQQALREQQEELKRQQALREQQQELKRQEALRASVPAAMPPRLVETGC